MLPYVIFMLGSYFRDGDWMQNKLDLGSATIHAYTSLFLLVVVPMVLVNVLGVAHTGQSIRVISRCAIVVIYAVYRLLPYSCCPWLSHHLGYLGYEALLQCRAVGREDVDQGTSGSPDDRAA